MRTYKFYLMMGILMLTSWQAFTQETEKQDREVVVYSVFLNMVPENFSFPLIGFVNIAQGDQRIPEVGFVNVNGRDLRGVQVGFVNVDGGDLDGAQVAFVNIADKEANGAQLGFVNLTGDTLHGTQLGFVNAARTVSGFTLGFVNVANSFEKGIPVGFISIVKEGGYQAFELYSSEMYPINLAFKIGVEKFYTSIIASYFPALSNDFAFGMGFGSVIGEGKFYFNPEISSQTARTENQQQLYNLSALGGYRLSEHFNATFGPSITLNRVDRSEPLNESSLGLFESEINSQSKVTVGLRLGLRYIF